MSVPPDDHFFRHEYGRLVAMLARRVGARHLETIEDAVQEALLAAVETWPRGAVPENPSAWLYRVAHNRVSGELRRQVRHGQLAAGHALSTHQPAAEEQLALLPGDIEDELLRMLFVCCDEALPVESQLVLALKTLCGFDVREIAERLFTTEGNVYKRLERARTRLRDGPDGAELTGTQLGSRLPAVHTIVHTLFTEGYLSSRPESAIRRELCDEALRLAAVLASHPVGQAPETFALLALMHLHNARASGRQDATLGLLLLEEQDRSLWDQEEIALGLALLARSTEGEVFSRYHAEAGIAAEHCLAPSFAETRWSRIAECYELLEQAAPSPLHTLSRALAIAEWQGPDQGLAVIEGLEPPAWLLRSYQWSVVLADLHRRAGNKELAEHHRSSALEAAPSGAIRTALARRLG